MYDSEPVYKPNRLNNTNLLLFRNVYNTLFHWFMWNEP